MKAGKYTSRDQNRQNILTPKEHEQMVKREAIAAMLEAGKTYKDIEKELHASTSTIALVARLMKG